MKQKRKISQYFRITSLALAIMFTAQACSFGLGGGGGGAETVELTWWKVFDDARQVQPLLEAFQKEFPKVRVKYVEKDVETYEDELLDALAAGRGPDIFTIHNDWLPKHEDKIAPFPATLMSLREFQESFVEVAGFDFIDDGQVWAVPLAVDVLAMYYNKDILSSAGVARPPQTWQELVELAPRLTRRDAAGNFTRSAVALGTANNINRAPDILGLLMLQNGTQFYSADRTVATLERTVRDAAGNTFSPAAQALEFYTQFAQAAKISYTWNARSNNSIEAFLNGQVAMIFSYSYLRPTLTERAPFLNYAVAAVPQIEASDLKINFANYWGEAVSKQSPNQAAAHAFLKFITSREVLPKYYEAVGQPSSRIDIIEEQIADSQIGVFAENALSARSFYKPDSDAVESIFVQMIDDVVLRQAAPAEAVQSASQKINLLLRNL